MKHIGRAKTTKDYPRVNVRIPQALYNHLVDEANKSMRSINSEITLRLTQTMAKDIAFDYSKVDHDGT